MTIRALTANELTEQMADHPEFITCPKCEGKAYSDGSENPFGWKVACCTCNGYGIAVDTQEGASMVTTRKVPIQLKIDATTLAEIDRVTSKDKALEGNRSLFIRLAIHEKLDRCEASDKKEAA